MDQFENREQLNITDSVDAADAPQRMTPSERREQRKARRSQSAGEVIAALPATLRRKFRRLHHRTKTVARESRAQNFPESNRLVVQLVLFALAAIHLWTTLARERLSHIRRRHIRLTGRQFHFSARTRRLLPPAFIACALVLAVGAVFFSQYTLATTVVYNGEVQGVMANERTAKRVASLVEAVTTETTGEPFKFEKNAIEYSSSFMPRSELTERDELEENLNREVGLVTYGYSLFINEELIGSTQYPGALESLLDQLKKNYASPDSLSIDFVEDVRIGEGYVPTESIVNLGQIAELLNSTKSGEMTYTVVRGDTWGKIAMEHDMTNSELELLNPGFDIHKLQIGDELMIANAVPYLTVVVTERQNYTDDIQFDITYEDDPNLYQGDYRVISKGVFGTADVVADVVYINGIESSRNILSSVILTDPVTEHRAQGTKIRPSWYPTGTFRWPCSGRITSYFGYRNTGIRGASTNHKGLDIALSYGAPIYAADGGRVTFAGYKGAMGRVVIIDHLNGFVTYYEHNSSLLVSAGQTVHKGQQIAKAGSTGVSNGVHCHFGVQKNGSYVNPLSYLP